MLMLGIEPPDTSCMSDQQPCSESARWSVEVSVASAHPGSGFPGCQAKAFHVMGLTFCLACVCSGHSPALPCSNSQVNRTQAWLHEQTNGFCLAQVLSTESHMLV